MLSHLKIQILLSTFEKNGKWSAAEANDDSMFAGHWNCFNSVAIANKFVPVNSATSTKASTLIRVLSPAIQHKINDLWQQKKRWKWANWNSKNFNTFTVHRRIWLHTLATISFRWSRNSSGNCLFQYLSTDIWSLNCQAPKTFSVFFQKKNFWRKKCFCQFYLLKLLELYVAWSNAHIIKFLSIKMLNTNIKTSSQI